MKVAIMGAGLSGLTCAIVLERHGIEPVIFEHRDSVGDRFVNGEVMLSLFSRPIRDEIAYLAERHQIYLHPNANINELIVRAKETSAVIRGRLGFINVRGRHEDAFEYQLAQQVKAEIRFNSKRSYDSIAREFTHVVMATGDGMDVEQLQDYMHAFPVIMKGATISGSFRRHQVQAWFNHGFAPLGYAYLIPYSDSEANIVIVFPQRRESWQDGDLEALWHRFIQRVSMDIAQDIRVSDDFQIDNYWLGISRNGRIGNTLFTGNCFGTLLPMLGFGQFPSMLTGIYAAHDLLGLGSYEQLTTPIRRGFYRSLALRQWLERKNDEQMSRFVEKLNGYLGDKLFNSPVDVLKWGGRLARFLSQT